jgi:predicted nucleic acid-binding protein
VSKETRGMIENQPGGVYLDSNAFIYSIEGEPEIAAPLHKLFRALQNRKGIFVTSELTLAEVLAPTKKRGAVTPQTRRRYLDLLVWNNSVRLQAVTRDVLYETADFRKATGQKLPDAIHCVTAIKAKCRFLVSNDRGMGKLPTWMSLVNPDAGNVDVLIEALRA